METKPSIKELIASAKSKKNLFSDCEIDLQGLQVGLHSIAKTPKDSPERQALQVEFVEVWDRLIMQLNDIKNQIND